MTPLYDILTVQPSLDAGQLQIKDMKLAMQIGKSRRYKVMEIQTRHFVETDQPAGFSREQVADIFENIQARQVWAFATTLAEMSASFPGALFDSVKRGFELRVQPLHRATAHKRRRTAASVNTLRLSN